VGRADRIEEKRHCRGLVISEADWSSAAHLYCAMMMPGAGTLERKLRRQSMVQPSLFTARSRERPAPWMRMVVASMRQLTQTGRLRRWKAAARSGLYVMTHRLTVQWLRVLQMMVLCTILARSD
jgi:hypothetical protein